MTLDISLEQMIRPTRDPRGFLSSGEHADDHQPSDTPDGIDNDKVARTTRLIVRMLDRVGNGAL